MQEKQDFTSFRIVIHLSLAFDFIQSSQVRQQLSAARPPEDRRRLQGGKGTTNCPFPTTESLSFAGFFFPLLQPMLGRGKGPDSKYQVCCRSRGVVFLLMSRVQSIVGHRGGCGRLLPFAVVRRPRSRSRHGVRSPSGPAEHFGDLPGTAAESAGWPILGLHVARSRARMRAPTCPPTCLLFDNPDKLTGCAKDPRRRASSHPTPKASATNTSPGLKSCNHRRDRNSLSGNRFATRHQAQLSAPPKHALRCPELAAPRGAQAHTMNGTRGHHGGNSWKGGKGPDSKAARRE
jgi:hypothetical protein